MQIEQSQYTQVSGLHHQFDKEIIETKITLDLYKEEKQINELNQIFDNRKNINGGYIVRVEYIDIDGYKCVEFIHQIVMENDDLFLE